MANATGVTGLTATISSDSVHLITLTYTRALWLLVWEWFARNILNVLASACALIAVALALAGFSRIKAAREKAAREGREAALAAKLQALQEGVRAGMERGSATQAAAWEAGRWGRVRGAVLTTLKQVIFQRAAGAVAAQQHAAAEAAAAAAAAARLFSGAGAKKPFASSTSMALKLKSMAAIGKGRAVLQQQQQRGEGAEGGGGEDAVVHVQAPSLLVSAAAPAAAALARRSLAEGRGRRKPGGALKSWGLDSEKE